MKKALLVHLSCMLLCGALQAADCPPNPIQPCPKPPFGASCNGDGSNCKLPLDFFATNLKCTGDHAPIWISVGNTLTIVNSNAIPSKFKVGPFKQFNATFGSGGVSCNYKDPHPGSANPFHDPNLATFQNSHALKAQDVGCYEVNLILQMVDSSGVNCKIDPHIIIGGTNFIQPTAVDLEHSR